MVKKVSQLIILFCFTLKIDAQLISWDKKVDFGILNNKSQNFIDLPVTNTSSENIFIFRLDVDRRFKVQFSDKKIKPDSTEFIRIAFEPKKNGIF